MNINQFYWLEDCIPAITVQLTFEDSYFKQHGYVQKRLLAGDYEGIKFPAVFIHYRGRRWEDILGVGWPTLYVISEKIKNIFEKNNLTGWKTFPVEVLNKRKKKMEGYYGMSITGKCGPVDDSKSEIVPYTQSRYVLGEKHTKAITLVWINGMEVISLYLKETVGLLGHKRWRMYSRKIK